MENKELDLVKQQVSKAVAVANSITIEDDTSMLEAGEIRKKIKTAIKFVKDRMEAPVKRAYEAYKEIKTEQEQTFGEYIKNCEEAQSVIDRKMDAYQEKVEVERKKVEADALKKLEETQRKLEEGKLTEKQVEKIEAKLELKLEKAPEVIRSSVDFHTREVQKFRIINEADIPREYLVPDEVKIRRAMMAGTPINGVDYYKEKIRI